MEPQLDEGLWNQRPGPPLPFHGIPPGHGGV